MGLLEKRVRGTPSLTSKHHGGMPPARTATRDTTGRPTPLKHQTLLPVGLVYSTSVSLVIPTKNESRNIAWVLERVPRLVGEILIVDGQSVDGTVEVALSARPDVVVVHEERPGKGAALLSGFRVARGDILVAIDGDGSMDPAEIVRHVALIESGFDFIKGSRFMAGGDSTDITRLRRFGNWALKSLTNSKYRSSFSDLCYGFVSFRRVHLPKLLTDADGFEIEAQLIVNAQTSGLKISEVPSHEAPRRHGNSNLRVFRDGFRVLRTLLRGPTTATVMTHSQQQGP